MKSKDLEKVKQFLKTDSDIVRSNMMTLQMRIEDAKSKKKAINQTAFKTKIDITDTADQLGAGQYLRFTALRSNMIDKDVEQMQEQLTILENKLFEAVAEEKKIEYFADKLAADEKKQKQKHENEVNDFIGMMRYMRR